MNPPPQHARIALQAKDDFSRLPQVFSSLTTAPCQADRWDQGLRSREPQRRPRPAGGLSAATIFDARQAAYRRIRHVATAAGARTSLFVPELDLLFVAARATASEPASLWVFRPNDAIDESLE